MPDNDVSVGDLLRSAAQVYAAHLGHALSGHGVTAAEWLLLRELHGAGAVAPSVLSSRLGITRGAVTKLVDRLRAKRLLVRVAAGRDDRRYQTIALTGAGALLVPELAGLTDAADARSFAALSARARTSLAGHLRAIVERCGD